MFHRLILSIFIFIIFIVSCESPEKKINQISSLKNLTEINKFIDKYPDHELAEKVINLRDSLVFISILKSNQLDSLQWFINKYPESIYVKEAHQELNILIDELELYNRKNESIGPVEALSSLIAYINKYPEGRFIEDAMQDADFFNNAILNNAKNEAKDGLRTKNNKDGANKFQKSGDFYLDAVQFYKVTEKETDSLYERAAYAYYKASWRMQNELAAQIIQVFNEYANGERDLPYVDSNSIYSNPIYILKVKYYQKSIELYKMANMTNHAIWLEKDDEYKKYVNDKIESEWND